MQWYDLKDFFREAGFDVVYASVSAHADGSRSKGCGVAQRAGRDVETRPSGTSTACGAFAAPRARRPRATARTRSRRAAAGAAVRRGAPTRASRQGRRGAFDEFGGLLPWVGAEIGPLPRRRWPSSPPLDDETRDAKDYAAADAIRDDVRDLYELRIDDR